MKDLGGQSIKVLNYSKNMLIFQQRHQEQLYTILLGNIDKLKNI